MSEFIIYQCRSCGGNLKQISDNKFLCENCANEYFVESSLSSIQIKAGLSEGTLLRNSGKFAEADAHFIEVLRQAKSPQDNVQGYWGRFLCAYGVMHVYDEKLKKCLPTIGKKMPSACVFEDVNYKKTIEFCENNSQVKQFEREAQYIQDIKNALQEEQKNDYQIFICHKKTAGENAITIDYSKAKDYYNLLTKEGYKVFFADESLTANSAGSEYEAQILASLTNSKIMLLVASSRENLDAEWVRNEWLRFLSQAKINKEKVILPILIGGMDGARLPDQLKKIQALRGDELEFKEKLLKFVRDRLVSANTKINRVEIKQRSAQTAERIALETRNIGKYNVGYLKTEDSEKIVYGEKLLKSGKFNFALEEFNNVLKNNGTNGRALLGKLLAEEGCVTIEEFSKKSVPTFLDYQSVIKIIEYNEREIAKRMLSALCVEIFVCAENKLFKKVRAWLEQVASYNEECVLQLRRKLFDCVIDLYNKSNHLIEVSEDDLCAIINCYLNYEENTALYYEGLTSFVTALTAYQKSKKASEYAKKLLDYDGGTYQSISLSLCAKHATKNLIKALIFEFESGNNEVIGELLGATGNKIEVALEELFKGVLEELNCRGANEFLIKVFDSLCSFVPEKYNYFLCENVFAFAKALKRLAKFEESEKYFAILIGLCNNNDEYYWHLLQAKLKCKNSDELIECDTPIGAISEFKTALQLASRSDDENDDQDHYSTYLSIQELQEKRFLQKEEEKQRAIEKQKENAKKELLLKKKKTKITIILSACFALIVALVAVFGYLLPSQKAVKARQLVESGKFDEAKEIYSSIAWFSDSAKTVELLGIIESAQKQDLVQGITLLLERGIEVTLKYDLQSLNYSRQAVLSANAFQNASTEEVLSYTSLSQFNGLKVVERAGYENAIWGVKSTKVSLTGKNCVTFELIASWRAKNYLLTYDLQGGSFSNQPYSQYTVESDDFTLTTPSKVGYTFVGWTGANFNEPSLSITIAKGSLGDRHYVANWSANSYIVFYDGNGGTSSIESESVYFDGVFSPSAVATRDGYTFEGWCLNEESYTGGVWQQNTNVTLTAKWKANSYNITYNNIKAGYKSINVTFDYNYSGSSATMVSLAHGEILQRPNMPERSKYVFLGWFTDSNCTKEYDFTGSLKNDITLYAKWHAVSYNVHQFDASEYTSNNVLHIDLGNTMSTRTRYYYFNVTGDGNFDFYFMNERSNSSYAYVCHLTNLTTGKVMAKITCENTTFTKKTFQCSPGDVIQMNMYKRYAIYEDCDAYLYFDGMESIPSSTAISDSDDIGSFTYEEGSIYTASVIFDSPICLITPTKEGYAFDGWYFEEQKIDASKWTYLMDITVDSKWISENE